MIVEPNILAVSCEWCRAKQGERCDTRAAYGGDRANPTDDFHDSRRLLWAIAGKPEFLIPEDVETETWDA